MGRGTIDNITNNDTCDYRHFLKLYHLTKFQSYIPILFDFIDFQAIYFFDLRSGKKKLLFESLAYDWQNSLKLVSLCFSMVDWEKIIDPASQVDLKFCSLVK